MSKKRWIFNSLLALILTFSLLAAATGSALAKKDDPPKADPRLLQMAEENPDAIFMVIVQRDAKNKDLKKMELEGEVTKGGGKVTKQLDLIVSFSAELTGKELTKLARHPKVRWISAAWGWVPWPWAAPSGRWRKQSSSQSSTSSLACQSPRSRSSRTTSPTLRLRSRLCAAW